MSQFLVGAGVFAAGTLFGFIISQAAVTNILKDK